MAIADIVLPVTFKSDPRGLKKAEDQLRNFGKNVGRIAGVATAAVGGIAVAGVKAFADFDEKLQQSVSIMGNVSDAMREDMSDAAREVAKQTTFSAEQAAESFFFLASAGLDAEASIGALPKVAQFAQAGMFDMATATDLLTDAQSALGLTSDDTAENLSNMTALSDVLVKANTLANASVSQFSEALTNKAAASMRSLNIETEEGVAVLATFADQGIKGSEAGTTFNATIRGLTNGVQRNAEEFDRLGVEVFNAEGELNNMADIVGDLEGALGGMTVEQQRAELTALGFTEETLAGTLALLGNSEAIREYEAELRNAGGTTDDVANKQLNTFSSQLSLLKSAFTDVGIEIGSMLVPHLSRLVQSMGPLIAQAAPALVSLFLSLMPVLEELIAGFPDFVVALMPLIPIMGQIAGLVAEAAVALFPILLQVLEFLLPVFESLTAALQDNAGLIAIVVASIAGLIGVGTAISKIITFFSAFKVVIGAVIGLFKGLGTVFTVVKGAFAAFSAVLMANPLVLIIAAVAALTAGLVWFFTQTEMGKELWASFVQFFKDLITGMREAWANTTEQVAEDFAALNDKVMAISEAIAEFFAYVFTEWIPGIWDSFVSILSGIWDGFTEGFMTAVGAIGDFFNTAIEGIQTTFETVFGAIGDFFKGIVNFYIGLWEGFINFLIGGLNGLIKQLNKISVDVPATAFNDAFTLGINLPLLPEVNLPRLAKGGVVDRTTIAMIGEAGPEAVIPLDRLGEFGGGPVYNVTVNAGMGTDGPQVAEQIVRLIRRYERNSGPVFARA